MDAVIIRQLEVVKIEGGMIPIAVRRLSERVARTESILRYRLHGSLASRGHARIVGSDLVAPAIAAVVQRIMTRQVDRLSARSVGHNKRLRRIRRIEWGVV